MCFVWNLYSCLLTESTGITVTPTKCGTGAGWEWSLQICWVSAMVVMMASSLQRSRLGLDIIPDLVLYLSARLGAEFCRPQTWTANPAKMLNF